MKAGRNVLYLCIAMLLGLPQRATADEVVAPSLDGPLPARNTMHMAAANSATERATLLAAQILDDLRGSAYYADPKIMAGVIRTGDQTTLQDEKNAQDLIRLMLQRFSKGDSQDEVKEGVAAALKGFGIR